LHAAHVILVQVSELKNTCHGLGEIKKKK